MPSRASELHDRAGLPTRSIDPGIHMNACDNNSPPRSTVIFHPVAIERQCLHMRASSQRSPTHYGRRFVGEFSVPSFLNIALGTCPREKLHSQVSPGTWILVMLGEDGVVTCWADENTENNFCFYLAATWRRGPAIPRGTLPGTNKSRKKARHSLLRSPSRPGWLLLTLPVEAIDLACAGWSSPWVP